MAYTVLARRYRSTTFDEVIGQNHIAQTLKRAIETNRLAHAFLFCGTRGTGKTSTARILAKALNCESADGPTPVPCNKCESCLAIARGDDIDVIEIDAASNTGVDNIRELIENSQYRPARSRFKIYIIDEVHMLSKSAFNALLKTLEEPPSHVKFILATTEAEKVLPTIQSRCQRYDFRNIPTREIAEHLRNIVNQEKIEADDDALLLVAKAGAGSMRDSLSLLDRLLSVGQTHLTVDQIEQMLGLPRSMQLLELAQAIGEANIAEVLQRTDQMIQDGLSPETLVASLTDHLRNILILRTCGAQSKLVEVPGVPPTDLQNQANLFDPGLLVQNITILEELRRLLRQSQAGRALIDATLVRLALAEQFADVGELLLDPNRAGGTAQKKKPELRPIAPPAASTPVPAATAVPMQSRAAAPAARPATVTSSAPPARTVDPFAAPAVTPPSNTPAASGVTAVAPPDTEAVAERVIDVDLGDADDLPAVGRVWEGPSLKEALAGSAYGSRVSVTADKPAEAPIDADLVRIWSEALVALEPGNIGMVGALREHAQLVAVAEVDGNRTATIRFHPDGETFIRMCSASGKREKIQDVLSQLIGHPTGITFDVNEAARNAAPVARPVEAPRRPTPQRPEPVEEEPAPMPTGIVPLSPELIEELQQDPLIAAIQKRLGGAIVKVVDET